jgi:hypothetical protein
MTLESYYNQIVTRYENNEYTVKIFKSPPPTTPTFHLEAQHFMMYEWFEDNWDDRSKEIFDYILIPNDCDYDFYSTNFEDFLKFLASIKVKEEKPKLIC